MEAVKIQRGGKRLHLNLGGVHLGLFRLAQQLGADDARDQGQDQHDHQDLDEGHPGGGAGIAIFLGPAEPSARSSEGGEQPAGISEGAEKSLRHP